MLVGDLSTNETLVICTAITAVPATIGAFVGLLNRREMKTPSGDKLGEVVERTHDLAAATVAHTTLLVNGETKEANGNA